MSASSEGGPRPWLQYYCGMLCASQHCHYQKREGVNDQPPAPWCCESNYTGLSNWPGSEGGHHRIISIKESRFVLPMHFISHISDACILMEVFEFEKVLTTWTIASFYQMVPFKLTKVGYWNVIHSCNSHYPHTSFFSFFIFNWRYSISNSVFFIFSLLYLIPCYRLFL